MSPGDLVLIGDELPGAPSASHRTTIERAEQLRATPGKWFRWPTRTAPSGVRKVLTAFGEGFEVEARRVDGTSITFARFVVDPKAPVFCPYCTRECGEGDPQRALAVHRRHAPDCDMRFVADGK